MMIIIREITGAMMDGAPTTGLAQCRAHVITHVLEKGGYPGSEREEHSPLPEEGSQSFIGTSKTKLLLAPAPVGRKVPRSLGPWQGGGRGHLKAPSPFPRPCLSHRHRVGPSGRSPFP